MRKSDREITDYTSIIELISRCDTIRLGMYDEEFPYVVPLSFGYLVENDKLTFYIHGAMEGKKHDLLKKNNKVCIEGDICRGFLSKAERSLTCDYESFIAYGLASVITGKEAIKGVDLICAHCGYEGFDYDYSVFDIMKVYKIEVTGITGKHRNL